MKRELEQVEKGEDEHEDALDEVGLGECEESESHECNKDSSMRFLLQCRHSDLCQCRDPCKCCQCACKKGGRCGSSS